MKPGILSRALQIAIAVTLVFTFPAAQTWAQQPDTAVTRLDLTVGRSYPLRTDVNVTKVSIVAPDIADVVVISEREVVINSLKTGDTDAIVWFADGTRTHYRIAVQSPVDRKQIAISVKFAEVRRDALRNLGVSGLWKDSHTRVGTGIFSNDQQIDQTTGKGIIPTTTHFLSVLSDLGTKDVLSFLDAEEQRGNARLLAEPNIVAGNKDTASFLAGGELPIPVVQGASVGGTSAVTIQYHEFGIRLRFVGEVISDSLIKLNITPEVSSLDFSNAVVLQGFRIPAFLTRRMTSTLDVKQDQSLVISGMFSDLVQNTKTGLPILKDIPILGALFSSSEFQRNESELLVVVTPELYDPMNPPTRAVMQFVPDSTRPATDALKKQMAPKRP